MPPFSNLSKALEFDTVLALIKNFALSEMARDKLDTTSFLDGLPAVELALHRLSEFKDIIGHDDPFPFNELWDIRASLKIASVAGRFVPLEGLLQIAGNLATANRVKKYLHARKDRYLKLWLLIEPLTPLPEVEKKIDDVIDGDTRSIRDSASPELRRIRREISRVDQQVRKAVEGVFRLYEKSGYLQESLITLSDGRMVFPVRYEHRGKVKGLIHDQSSSGATVFVEPMESFELNNKIRGLRLEESREVERILTRLTDMIRDHLEPVIQNLAILIDLDCIRAKALWANKWDCCKPALNDGSKLAISNGRHPLLLLHKQGKGAVVPLNLRFPDNATTLVITGPNAGGKSVALKTVGLLCLMVSVGLLVPADPDSNFPLFDNIFVDIGDSQSIEHDLSTFTSHLSGVRNILSEATSRSLVLIDEIGVGTDPEEGAALAVALLSELNARACRTIVTTHLGELKTFAFDTEGVENGSMEFDLETLEPKYRFRIGVPGSSYAIEIARRLGLPETLLTHARNLIGKEKGRLESLLLDLEERLQKSNDLRAEIEIEKSRLEGLVNLYEQRYQTLKEREQEIKQKALAESEEILQRSNAAVERAIREIREQQAAKEAIASARNLLDEERKNLRLKRSELKKSSDKQQKREALKIEVGEDVRWEAQRATGRIVSVPDDSDKVLIELGNMKVWVKRDELSRPSENRAQKQKRRSTFVNVSSASEVLPEIDLRGCFLEDAIVRVDKFIDEALLAGWEEVRIIHGKGTGALRKGIVEFLNKHENIGKIRMGAWNEGDMGVTIAQLK
jgi:DNA mismatch repair protein MutS2